MTGRQRSPGRVQRVLPRGAWIREHETATVTLTFEDRHRRRIRLVDDAGEPFLLDLPEAVRLRDGDGLELDDGSGVIRVVAAAEPVADVGARDVAHLARLAWHLGNRHLPVEVVGAGRGDGLPVLRIADDHVIAAMAEGLGATVVRHRAPFQPEAGAYATRAGDDGPGHGHAEAHAHSHTVHTGAHSHSSSQVHSTHQTQSHSHSHTSAHSHSHTETHAPGKPPPHRAGTGDHD